VILTPLRASNARRLSRRLARATTSQKVNSRLPLQAPLSLCVPRTAHPSDWPASPPHRTGPSSLTPRSSACKPATPLSLSLDQVDALNIPCEPYHPDTIHGMPSPMDECDNLVNIEPAPQSPPDGMLKRKLDGSAEEYSFPCKKMAVSPPSLHKSSNSSDGTTNSTHKPTSNPAQPKLSKAEREAVKAEKAKERELERQKREAEKAKREEEKVKKEEERVKKVRS
jgi:hypothetical protein